MTPGKKLTMNNNNNNINNHNNENKRYKEHHKNKDIKACGQKWV